MLNCFTTLAYLMTIGCIHASRINFSVKQHFIGVGPSASKAIGFSKEPCQPIEENALARILGAAYNPRYMSLEPPEESEDSDDRGGMKRTSSGFRPFSVDADFSDELDMDVPAWQIDHFAQNAFSRAKRHSEVNTREERLNKQSTPWDCESTVKWVDLGRDYFPRYLRSVECGNHDCWYGRYSCKPKSFTVKILRRKRGKCAYAHRKESLFDLPEELRELWVWEERAVNFCCECAP